jgi:preprotein translocase subunit SecA
LEAIHRGRSEFAQQSDADLKSIAWRSMELPKVFALTAVIASRVLGLNMFNVQLEGARALAAGKIAEMQTGEGKRLAAVPAVVLYAKEGRGVHVMTVNDYLARRDAQWMNGSTSLSGFRRPRRARHAGRRASPRLHLRQLITCATANEIGFEHLRDGFALFPIEQVQRPFAAAVIDEADSILIDEARIRLVIAGGEAQPEPLAYHVGRVARRLRRSRHFTLDEYGRNLALTDAGIRAVETAFGCGNLFSEENLALLTAVRDSVHAHALRRGGEYLVKNGAIESVDELKGRIAQNRRWPAGLHTAIEANEGVALRTQGGFWGRSRCKTSSLCTRKLAA